MILRFYPTKDATIYENDPERNTGMDQILEIIKVPASASSGIVTGSYNSRILLDFDYTAISSSIVRSKPNTRFLLVLIWCPRSVEHAGMFFKDSVSLSGAGQLG